MAIYLFVILGVIILALLTPYIEIVIWGTQIGSITPPPGPLLILFFLVFIVNSLLLRLRRREISRTHLLFLYAVLLLIAVLPSCQFAQWLPSVVTGPFYFGTPENKWLPLTKYIPHWWTPLDKSKIKWFYEGLPPGEHIPWGEWARPFLAFAPMVMAFYFTLFCLSFILHKHWIENEKLTFPLVQLPLEITSQARNIFKDKLFWLGTAIPVSVHLLNGLSYRFPFIPSIPLRDIQIGIYFTSRPWNAINPFFICIYFCLIGFAFLTSRDVPFSIWFFFLLYKLSCVFGSAMGWTPGWEDRSLRGTSFPYIEAQEVGSMLALVGMGLWGARRHIREMWRIAFKRERDDPEAPLYRLSFIGGILGFVVLVIWGIFSGMSLWLSFTIFFLSILFALGVNRLMAEGGVNFLWAAQSGPNYLIFALEGGRILRIREWLVLLSLPYFIWNFKGPVGPQSFESFKISQEARLSNKRLFYIFPIAMLLAMGVAYFYVIYIVHTKGGGVSLCDYRFVHVGQRPFMELVSVTDHPEKILPIRVLMMVFAFAFTIFLFSMRWRFLWWRFHPIGYVTSTIWATNYMWFSLFLGSFFNYAITKVGGLKLYRRARLFFLGFIMGDFLMLGFWLLIDAFVGTRGFRLFGN
jgi:hypothetical protein